MNIGIYCSSSNWLDAVYYSAAEDMGRHLAERAFTLVYGGGNVGLMGVLARAVHKHGGRVIGVIPEALKAREGIAYEIADELVVTATMQERKATIFEQADAFVVLPGGFGTLEEFMEVLTLKQLGYHNKAIALVNTDGFYDRMFDLFDFFYANRFAHERYRVLYHAAAKPEEALDYIASYEAVKLREKWI